MEGMRKEISLKIASFTIVFTAPVILTCISLATCRALGYQFSASLVFTLLYCFNTLRHPLMLLPIAERSLGGI